MVECNIVVRSMFRGANARCKVHLVRGSVGCAMAASYAVSVLACM